MNSKPERPRTGKYCVAFGCKSTHRDNLSMHEFPRDENIRRQWITFVKTKRKDFTKPSRQSVLCEKHFPPGSYPIEYEIKKSMNIPVKRKVLLPEAVPTIHIFTPEEDAEMPGPPILTSTPLHGQTLSPPKKLRSAYRKRECTRVLFDYSNASTASTSTASTSTVTYELEGYENEGSLEQLEQPSSPQMKTVGLQFSGKKPIRRSVRVQTKPSTIEKGVQVNKRIEPKYTSIGIQCNRYLDRTDPLPEPELEEKKEMSFDLGNTTFGSDVDFQQMEDDSDFHPESEEDIISDESITGECHTSSEKKYIVFESKLLDLFRSCPRCASPALAEIDRTFGSLVKVQQSCAMCGLNRVWDSQPYAGGIPAGNLLLSCAILFSGSLPSKTVRLLEHMNVATISTATFQRHQRYYLHPAVEHTWQHFQDKYVADMIIRGTPLTLGGDGRADTPGHSAKYGSYGMVDLDLMLVVDIQLVQSNEVKSSYHMEKEGFVRSVAHLQNSGLQIGQIVTDRHVQLVKHIRECMPDTTHTFDVWHVAKGLKKKLTSLSREKQCEELQPWIKSICNHLYWVAASTPDGNGQLMMEKWLSLGNHIQNLHVHDGELFPMCQHPELEGEERRKKWFKPGTKVCEKVQDIISSNQMKKDVPKLSTGPQTATLEAFHSVINHFAPKMIGFSYHGMLSRSSLVKLLCGLYALVIVVLGIVFATADSLTAVERQHKYYLEIFLVYLYFGSLAVLLYFQIALLRGVKVRNSYFETNIKVSVRPDGSIQHKSPSATPTPHRAHEVNHDLGDDVTLENGRAEEISLASRHSQLILPQDGGVAHVGEGINFYLRLGALAFAFGSVTLDGLHIASYFESPELKTCGSEIFILVYVMHLLFTFVQTFFLFKNHKVVIDKQKAFVRFGMMHIMATNLCVLLVTAITEIAEDYRLHDYMERKSNNETIILLSAVKSCYDVITLARSASPFLFPTTIIYSIIAAGIVYRLYQYVGVKVKQRWPSHTSLTSSVPQGATGIDCDKANKGLFSGLLVAVLTLIAIATFFVFESRISDPQTAIQVFYITEIALMVVTAVGIVWGFKRLATLKFLHAYFLSVDSVLLIVALAGSYIYLFFILISVLSSPELLVAIGIMSVITIVLALIQITMQIVFILDGLCRCAENDTQMTEKPGRSVVTFLLVCNLAMWVVSMFEIKKTQVVSMHEAFYGNLAWNIITHLCVPLLIFFRFHSAICLSKIWYNAYQKDKQT